MKIAVFGLGYVGMTTAACLASEDHEVIGVDASDGKAALPSPLAKSRRPCKTFTSD